MTVVAWDGHCMAADRNSSLGGTLMKRNKVRRIRGHLLGGCGNSDRIQDFMDWFERGARPEEYKMMTETTVLVVSPARKLSIYQLSPFGTPLENRVFAIGSGGEAALAAMETMRFCKVYVSARRAVEIASKVVYGVGGGVDSMDLT